MTLRGKWPWLWNLSRCDAGQLATIAGQLKAAGCAGIIIKTWDGTHSFPQRGPSGLIPLETIGATLHAAGLKVATWGYCYGADPAGEAAIAAATASDADADAIILDVEVEYKRKEPQAHILCSDLRRSLPDVPLLYSTFAIARYHRDFPFDSFNEHCAETIPQIYWNAFGWPMAQSLQMTYDDYRGMGVEPHHVLPAGGLYTEGTVTYPTPPDVRAFIQAAKEAGSPGCSFWGYEHMDQTMWDAVAAIQWPVPDMPWTGWQGEDDMSFTDDDRLVLLDIQKKTRPPLVRVAGTGRVYIYDPATADLTHVIGPEILEESNEAFKDVHDLPSEHPIWNLETRFPAGVPQELRA